MDNTRVAECYRATQANTMPMSLSTVDVNLFTKKQTVGYEVASCLFLSFRPKNEVKEQKENQCEPCCDGCLARRKRLFIQNPLTCQCSCRNSDADCRARQLELNERSCRCDKPRR
ncbi:unnamed protein product [Oncorhynchus mykiss]|uniref:Vascular endothelial growth factor heparin-binding domain-containing protein n=1 Tax=Oncorhynchus mykiss TaxID=8022 RepID=A0A060WW14_ONCMY|nr:unnamed protein product [Oncorhynchus mykiss]